MELFAISLAPYPGLEDIFFLETYPDREVEVELRINVVFLATAMLLRLYLMIRFLLSSSKYRDSRQQRLCMINGTEATFMYAMKAVKKD